ncbi:MAG TPA: hypothetical protein VLC51_09460, partial [Nitrospira sp.]|nr:hypothetical protein [Nitrospira sp.]
DPQRNDPPQLMLSALKWTPRPSLRTAFGLGAAAMAIIAAVRRTPTRRQSTVSDRHLEEATLGS